MSTPSPLPPPSVEQPCYRHPDRLTGRRCTRCGKPACPDCLTQVAVGSQCRECIKAAAPSRAQQARVWNAGQMRLVTSILIAVNLFIFLADQVFSKGVAIGGYRSIEAWGILNGPQVHDGQWWRLIASGFLHENVLHVGMNMFVLYQIGALLEPLIGRTRFVVVYFSALLAGSAGALLLNPHDNTLGASGAIFGLLGAVAVAMHLRGVNIWNTGIGGIIVINLVFTLAVPGISIGGHIGGLIGGAIAGYAITTTQRRHDGLLLGIGASVAVAAVALGVALYAAQLSVS
ncbi:MAG: rhomboid family protein [Acidimicrobiia bacterium]|nr:rhomboid family protein [Acidimicrobiia bacterium]